MNPRTEAFRRALADMAVTEAIWAEIARELGYLPAYAMHTRAVIRIANTLEHAMAADAAATERTAATAA